MDKTEYLDTIQKTIEAGPYADTWESLASHPIADWYKAARVGFFIHWGVYSVPAYFNEWYPRWMYYRQTPVYYRHNKKYGKNFDYHQFIPMFKAEKFDSEVWLKFFEECGADFVMPVAEHHDGFKMYKSDLSKWNAFEMGPKRDVLGEIGASCEKRGIKLAASSHRAEHYWFMNGGRTLKRDNAVKSGGFDDFYGPAVINGKTNGILSFYKQGKGVIASKDWLEDWLMSSCEIVDKYKPSAFYFDFWTKEEEFRPYMRKFLAYFYNTAAKENREVVSFYKMDAALYPCGVFVQERGQIPGISPDSWQCETSTAYNSWSFCTTNIFKKAETIARNMVDVWSKNGCMALNIGPKADGSICEQEIGLLTTLGTWIQKNKEGIWGTRPFKVFGEGRKQKSAMYKEFYKYGKKDFRFTYKLGCVYAFALVPKNQTKFRIYSLSHKGASNAKVKSVTILGEDIAVKHTEHTKYLELVLDRPTNSRLPVCFKINVE